MPTTQQHRNHWRRYSVLALLAAATLTRSFLFASDNTDEAQSSHRQLKKAKKKKKAKKVQPAKPAKLSSLKDPKTAVPRVDDKVVAAAAGGPNIIYLQHESLSGAIALNTEEGVKAMPFFQDMMHNDPNFYVFEHVRAVSGIATDAMPALMTGCLPYTDAALTWVQTLGRSVGYDFRRLGYRTASFTSRELNKNIKSTHWNALYDMLVGAMEKVVDPLSKKWRRDNNEGSDDRRMLPEFEEWLDELRKDDASHPFYAQMYNFNQHYPYMRKEGPRSTNRYYQSLATTDEFLQRLFDILDRMGRLQNTIIVGSGDYGEEPFKGAKLAHLEALNSNILQPVSYIYYPRHLMPHARNVAHRLRSNTQKLTHTLDLYQTIQGIINHTVAPKFGWGGSQYDPPNVAPGGCITGVDLAAVDVPEDRAVISLNLFSSQNTPKGKKRQLWALSTKELSLYHRVHSKKHPQLQQGKNDAYILLYGNCTRDTSPGNLCQAALTEEYKEYFRGVIEWIKKTPLYDEGVKTSKLVEFFNKAVAAEPTLKTAATKKTKL